MLALCTASFGQTTYMSSPPGYLSTEGEDRAYIMFEWSNARTMFLDGEMRNNVIFIKDTAFRYDYRNYSTGIGQGRTWSNVTLDISLCDYSNPSFTFSQNPTATPTRVFSSSMTLPTQTGFPSTKPAKFTMSFPFSAAWLYNGNEDICLDYDFNGGVMANNASWSTSWYWSYFLDAPSAGTRVRGVFSVIGTGCTDSGQSYPAQCWVTSYVHNSKYTGNTSLQDKYRVYTRTRYTPQNQPVIHAITPFGSKTGTSFPGVTCEKIYLDLSQYFLTIPLVGNGSTPVYGPDFIFPYQKSLEGVKLYAQAAFPDSSTNALKFTYAEDSILPAYPRVFKRGCLWQTNTALKATTAIQMMNGSPLQGPVEDATHNPIIGYGK